MMERIRVPADAYWDDQVAYSRAVRVGHRVLVAGTTASTPEGAAEHPGDAGAQAREVLRRIEAALDAAGAQLSDVVRTRVFLVDLADWAAVGEAHRAAFSEVRPVSTMVQVSGLLHPDLLVEIEAEAVVASVQHDRARPPA